MFFFQAAPFDYHVGYPCLGHDGQSIMLMIRLMHFIEKVQQEKWKWKIAKITGGLPIAVLTQADDPEIYKIPFSALLHSYTIIITKNNSNKH